MNFRCFLPELWSWVLYYKIRDNNGNIYGISFLDKHKKDSIKWIESTPGRANTRLRIKNNCVYCQKPNLPINGIGDHIVSEFEDKNIIWTVPCCKNCNSSKGKKDLIDWWLGLKFTSCTPKKMAYWSDDFINLDRDVISIFVRAKYRHQKNKGELDDVIPNNYLKILNQIKHELKFDEFIPKKSELENFSK